MDLSRANDLLNPGYLPFESGYWDLADGKRLVADKKLGFKSGEGFRKWSVEDQAALRGKLMNHLKAMRDR